MENPDQQQPGTGGDLSSLQWENIFQAIGQPTLILDPDHTVIAANQAALRAAGLDNPAGMIGHKCYHFFHHPQLDRPVAGCPLQRMLQSGRLETVEMELESLGGIYLVSTTPVLDENGALEKVIHIATDISENKRAEHEREELGNRLRQAQKMEAIGRLAGGIAHDFNNLLSVILGCCDMLMLELPAALSSKDDLLEIRAAADRASELTRQLLAFGSQQVLSMQLVDVSEVITDMERLLRRLISEDIRLQVDIRTVRGTVWADRAQLQQIVLNLVINARDASGPGGTIRIEADERNLDDEAARQFTDGRPGEFVTLSVQDVGTGMNADTRARLFEPFFTTKQRGKGTGLGLATVYGIVKQHEGMIRVTSAPGAGTTVTVFLPYAVGTIDAAKARVEPVFVPGSGTILVAEDEDGVRRLACRILRKQGYQTLEARTAEEALQVAARHEGQLDLLLTDVVMPDQNGKELHRRLLQDRPHLRVLYMSGYADEVVARHGVPEQGVHLLPKPFTVASLTRAVQEALLT